MKTKNLKSRRKELQYSLKSETLLKDHGNVMDNYIWSLKATPDTNYLFIGDGSGGIKQWGIKENRVIKAGWGLKKPKKRL